MKKKKFIIILSLILTISIFQFLPFPFPFWDYCGSYNTWSGLIWYRRHCRIHEIGHKLDHLSGWPSSTDSFNTVVKEMGLDLLENEKENYANIFVVARGSRENMPERLWPFYDFDLAEELLIKHK